MDCYVVMRRSHMDDLPLFVTRNLAEARRFVDECEKRQLLGERVGDHEMRLLGVWCDAFTALAICEFEDGRIIDVLSVEAAT